MPKSNKPRYSDRILTDKLIKRIPYYGGKSIVAHDGELEEDCSIGYHCIAKPMSFDFAHSHKFPEMLCFIGGNPEDITDFGAEIEFTLAGEKHTITTPAVVSIPGGVKHCPIVFKKVEKPIVFLEISLTRIWKSGRPRKKAPPVTVAEAAVKQPKTALKKSKAVGKKVKKVAGK